MDKSAVRAIVERDIEQLMLDFGIAHWKIKLSYEASSEPPLGRCTRLYDYNQAWLTLNPELMEDEDHVLLVLRHELYHIVISPFDLFRSTVEELLGEDRKFLPALERIWRNSMEKTVVNLGRMYVGLNEKRASDVLDGRNGAVVADAGPGQVPASTDTHRTTTRAAD